jgi:hypothetical protein
MNPRGQNPERKISLGMDMAQRRAENIGKTIVASIITSQSAV